MNRRIVAVLAAAGAITAFPVAAGHAATSAQVTAAAKLHAGEFCSKSKQSYYHRHGYTCRKARDGRNRLFTY